MFGSAESLSRKRYGYDIVCDRFYESVVVDGDKSLVVSDKTLIDVAKRNIEKFNVVPLYYDMKKAHAVQLSNESIYNGLNAAFVGGNIGIYSNNISKIWNSDIFISGNIYEQKEAIDLIKLLCAENNYTIDYAKTLYKPTRPSEINDKINAFTNNPLPHFFKYAKDKKEHQVVPANLSFVNKLENIIINPRMNFKKLGLGEINYRLLMHNPDIDVNMSFAKNGRIIEEETDPIIVEYSKFERKHYLAIDQAVNSSKNNKSEAYIRAQAKLSNISDEFKDAMSQFGKDDYEITDILVKYLYGTNKKNKTALWLCYGDIIYKNLSSRIKKKTKEVQCVDCGEWFEVSIFNSEAETIRCPECRDKHKNKLKSEQNRRAYQARKLKNKIQ